MKKRLILLALLLPIPLFAQGIGYGPVPSPQAFEIDPAFTVARDSLLYKGDTLNSVRRRTGTTGAPDVVTGVKQFEGPLWSTSYLQVSGNAFVSGRIKAQGFTNKVDTIGVGTNPYTLTTGQYVLLVNATDGTLTVQLPLGADDGTMFIIKRIAGANAITVQTEGYVMKIEGANTYSITSSTAVRFVKYGTKWWVV